MGPKVENQHAYGNDFILSQIFFHFAKKNGKGIFVTNLIFKKDLAKINFY
jgi:hypothetical protein